MEYCLYYSVEPGKKDINYKYLTNVKWNVISIYLVKKMTREIYAPEE